MEFYEIIGQEEKENYPELEVAEFETKDAPDTILLQGTWETENGEFLLEYEWQTESGKILWLRISEFGDDRDSIIADLDDLSEFKNHFPYCYENLVLFAQESKQ